jgi:hypothetical protein
MCRICDEVTRRDLIRGGLLLGAAALVGCTSSTTTTNPGGKSPVGSGEQVKVAPISNTDPCAMRLHDACAPLLIYYAINHRLPKQLDELQRVPGFDNVELTCPISGKVYLYQPLGLDLKDGGKAMIYDALPSHSGFRWAITVVEPQGAEALVAKVVAMPESALMLRSPG